MARPNPASSPPDLRRKPEPMEGRTLTPSPSPTPTRTPAATPTPSLSLGRQRGWSSLPYPPSFPGQAAWVELLEARLSRLEENMIYTRDHAKKAPWGKGGRGEGRAYQWIGGWVGGWVGGLEPPASPSPRPHLHLTTETELLTETEREHRTRSKTHHRTSGPDRGTLASPRGRTHTLS